MTGSAQPGPQPWIATSVTVVDGHHCIPAEREGQVTQTAAEETDPGIGVSCVSQKGGEWVSQIRWTPPARRRTVERIDAPVVVTFRQVRGFAPRPLKPHPGSAHDNTSSYPLARRAVRGGGRIRRGAFVAPQIASAEPVEWDIGAYDACTDYAGSKFVSGQITQQELQQQIRAPVEPPGLRSESEATLWMPPPPPIPTPIAPGSRQSQLTDVFVAPPVRIELAITHNVVGDGGAGHGQDSSIRFLVGRTRCLPTGCGSGWRPGSCPRTCTPH